MHAVTHARALPGTALSTTGSLLVALVGCVALLSLAVAMVLRRQVLAADEGTPRMRAVATAVQEGASAYLRRQFRTLVWFVAAVFLLLLLLPGEDAVRWGRSGFFLVGAGFSAAVGHLGMSLAVRANLRVAAAARRPDGREAGVRIALRTGGVVGTATVGLGLLGACTVVLAFRGDAPAVLEGFGFGAALLAMFMRVGGGIFTKAADIGADLVGKIERNIPEDDPRNAAAIADNVGDNVGDCAGMAADLFESYAVVLVAALLLGSSALGEPGLVLPLLVPAVGAVTSVVGILVTRVRPGGDPMRAIDTGFAVAAVSAAVLCTAVCAAYLPSSWAQLPGADDHVAALGGDPRAVAAGAVCLGVLLAGLILRITGHYTATGSAPTDGVARSSRTGAATVVLAGIGVGLRSAVYTALVVAAAVYAAFLLGGGVATLSLFLVALAGCGLLTTVGVIVAMDTFGPVSDNAQGIAEMSGDVGPDGARVLTELDAVGNTTKAVTKGIAIATAVLAATALFGAYTGALDDALAAAGVTESAREASASLAMTVVSPNVLVGLIVGVGVVFLFAGLAIDAVGRAAAAVVLEVRAQFARLPGIMDGSQLPEYGRVVDICTRDSLRELTTPGLLAVTAPIAVGFGLGLGPLAGFLAGAIGAGALMAVFLANSGGSWDNAKKLVEDGHFGGKGSEAHAATVIGDTVGDPFKDTAGPAVNPLLKVMNLVSVLIAPAVVHTSFGPHASTPLRLGIAAVAVVAVVAAVLLGSRARGGVHDLAAEAAVEPREGVVG